MNLNELAKAKASIQSNHAILIYGPSKAGKTYFVGTAAKLAEINRIYWFDLENGSDTLVNMGLTEEEMEKITIFKIPDVRDNPMAITTMLKVFSAKKPISICDEHGAVDCVECISRSPGKPNKPGTAFCLGDCGHNDLVVIDGGSQLADSALNAACVGQDILFKPGWDEYGIAVKYLSDIMSVIQQAKKTNFVVLTIDTAIATDTSTDLAAKKKDKTVPLMGTKAFSMKVSKYFGTVAYFHVKLGKHVAGSGSTYRSDVSTGSRLNIKLEASQSTPNMPPASMKQLLIDGGILKADSVAPAIPATTVSSLPLAKK